jgi:A/G-specific adenine glycosylase
VRKQSSEPRVEFDQLPQPFPEGIAVTGELVDSFREIIYSHYSVSGRSFPWRETSDPYHILLSEMMLQQTQTFRALPKYEEFLQRWPTLEALSRASLTDVLSCWKGLGYNRRALALKKIAEISTRTYGGSLPVDQKELRALPMVGPATSAALLAFAHGIPSLYLETNIRRVLIYFFYHEVEQVHDRDLYVLLETLLDRRDPRNWYYALMDYGVYLRTLVPNPNRRSAHYTRQAKFENSNRQIRGELLTVFTERGASTVEELHASLKFDASRIDSCVEALVKEGFIFCEAESAAEQSPRYRIS